MVTSIRKIGNSQGVILPKPALQALGVAEGGAVEFVYEPGKISIVPARRPVREGWEEDAKAIAAAGLTDEEREWIDADLTDDAPDAWDAYTEADMERVEAELLADGVVKS
ncbi:AbrB/MazE/SpoVT family DNA-binding domain-containing protein [Brevundimonas sp.]|uniref:AbrB/MazE/SpoVT family DNA-binding domain-containing protein n=1 Tax=Brevundimonas sp. TaxID=1871086 RepID=UPI001DDD33D3|nr:AbrB/MazE/SpoVT family DNA-binding domain-containing protein [Brevundimonas sp.]MBL0946795.1 AbrB/MazE/SpoVT family DNA-binding domain-containing protein [Brevundimonas sp.]